jgi:RsiW-degrading membrane proteinase PrsW (M82 family)
MRTPDQSQGNGLRAFLWSPSARLVYLVWLLAVAGAIPLAVGALDVFDMQTTWVHETRSVSVVGQQYLWFMVASLVIAVIGYAVLPTRLKIRCRWLLLPFATGLPAYASVLVLVNNPMGFLMAIPGAVFAIYVLHRVQRHRRMPLRVSLGAFLWGAFMTIFFPAQVLHAFTLLQLHIDAALPLDSLTGSVRYVLVAPLWEEFTKAAGVLVVFWLVRNRYDGPVHGYVLGAMVGAGFTFMETTRNATTTFDNASVEIWNRQWVNGIALSHVLFTGLFGAFLGLASRGHGRAGRLFMVGTGYALAVSAHFAWNYVIFNGKLPLSSDDITTYLYLVAPLNSLFLSAPFLVLVWVILWRGIRRESAVFRSVLPVEAMSGLGTVTAREAVALNSPLVRVGQRLRAVGRFGPLGYVKVGRLHSAQLDLAMERWRLAADPMRRPPEDETQLRQRVMVLKASLQPSKAVG